MQASSMDSSDNLLNMLNLSEMQDKENTMQVNVNKNIATAPKTHLIVNKNVIV